MKNKYGNSTGFTLVEVLIALLVFSIGMLGLIKLQGEVTLNSADSRMYTQAVNLAQDKVEELRNYVHQTTYDAYTSNLDGSEITGSNATFIRTWDITNNDLDGYQDISVTVSWVGIDGEDKEVVLTSQIAEVEPSRSGLVLAATPLIGVTPADSAAQAAAHAAAAARYEALVAVSSATDSQKQQAEDILSDAQDAAGRAQDAADNNDGTEAATQASIAYDAMNDILDILNSLSTINFTFSGTVDESVMEVVATYDATRVECPISDDTYTCTIASLQDAVVNVIATNANDDTQTCEIIMDIDGIEGCHLTFAESCLTPWGTTLKDGSQVLAYLDDNPVLPANECLDEVRQCDDGSLSGSYTFQVCEQFCRVPDYAGDKKSEIPASWNDYGGKIQNDVTGNGNDPKASNQSPDAGTNQTCNTTLIVE